MQDWEWDQLVDLVRREEDSAELQDLRGVVTRDDHDALTTLYRECTSWRAKGLVVQLLQDQVDPLLEEVWRDAVQVPDDGTDLSAATRAIALCALEGRRDPERFQEYFDDPARAMEAARRWLS
jgi:hypothetical protein